MKKKGKTRDEILFETKTKPFLDDYLEFVYKLQRDVLQ